MILAFAMALYLALSLANLNLPGLYYDEALDAVPAIQLLNGQPLDISGSIELFGHEWPLMVMTYVGPTTTYLLTPVFALFGVSVAALRLTNIALGVLSLALAWGFLQTFIGPRVAGLATVLLAVNPTFVFWSRMGAFVSLPMLPLAIGALWALYEWRRTGCAYHLAIAAFCLGLGLTTKLLFLWVWVALGLAWLLLSPMLGREPALRTRRGGLRWRSWLWPLRRLTWRSVFFASFAFLAGLAPLLIYNLRGLETVTTVLNNVGQTELYGVNNLDLLGNLRTVIVSDLRVLLEGTWFKQAFGAAHRNLLAVPALALSIAWLGWLALRRRMPWPGTRLAFLLTWLITITLQSAVTITSLGATHLMILWPMPQALVAMAVVSIPTVSATARRGALAMASAALLTVLVCAELWTAAQYHQTLARTGGAGSFSDVIAALNADLSATGVRQPIALDWGFRRSLQFLSDGQINTEERFEYAQQPGEDFAAWASDRIDRERRGAVSPGVYLLHWPAYTMFGGHWAAFEEVAYRYGMTPVEMKRYAMRNGEPVFSVYRLERASQLTQLPPNATPTDARLDEVIRLIGYDAPSRSVKAGDTFTMTLYWRADESPSGSYKVFAHLFGPEGQLAGQHDSVPRLWGYPTDEWQPGEVIADRVKIAVMREAAEGPHRVFVGMYDAQSGARLPLTAGGARLEGDTLGLVEVQIHP